MKALLDTNILIAGGSTGEAAPDLSGFDELCVSALSWAELFKGLHTTTDLAEYKARAARLNALRGLFGAGIPFDGNCADAYDAVLARCVAAGPSARSHAIDRMLAATALANDMTFVTRDRDGVAGLEGLVTVEVR